jgi:hypothetical protein
MSVVFVVACSSEQRAPAPNVQRSVSEPEVRDDSPVASAPPTPPPLAADAIVLSEPAQMPEPQYLAPRGRVKGKALRADRVVLHDDGADGQRLDLVHGPMAAGVCEPAGREATLVSVQALSESLFVLGEEKTGGIVAVNLEPGLDHSDFITGGVRTRAKLTRLEVATRVAEGEVSVTGPEGTSFAGRFVAAYCPHGRADPTPRPRVHAVEWDPDASPEASALPRGEPARHAAGGLVDRALARGAGRSVRPARRVVRRERARRAARGTARARPRAPRPARRPSARRAGATTGPVDPP